jgi:hypothetical protein
LVDIAVPYRRRRRVHGRAPLTRGHTALSVLKPFEQYGFQECRESNYGDAKRCQNDDNRVWGEERIKIRSLLPLGVTELFFWEFRFGIVGSVPAHRSLPEPLEGI